MTRNYGSGIGRLVRTHFSPRESGFARGAAFLLRALHLGALPMNKLVLLYTNSRIVSMISLKARRTILIPNPLSTHMQKPPNEKMSLGGSTIPVTYLLFDFSFVTGKSEAKVRQTIQVADIHFMHLFLFGKTPHVTFCTANNSTRNIKEAGALGIPRH